MKNYLSKIIPLTIAVLVIAALPAVAQNTLPDTIHTTPYRAYSTATTNGSTTLSYAVIGANSVSGGAPIITSIDVGSDKLTSKVQFYKVDATTRATFTNSTVRLDVGATNGLADNGTIVIRHGLHDTYEKRTLTTSTGATNLVVTVAPMEPVIPGDIIYHVTTAGAGFFNLVTNTVSANTMKLNLQGANLYTGQPGMPLLLEVDANSTAGSVNSVTANFLP